MNHGSRICPYCGGLNSADAETCHRCNRKLPGPLARVAVDIYKSVLGEQYQLTKLFIGMCAVVFVLTSLDAHKLVFLGDYSRSTEIRFGVAMTGLVDVEPWRYLSSCFFHFGILHIGFNMVALWDVGRVLEQRVGSARYAIAYVVTGIVGFIVGNWWFALFNEPYITGGASGAIFGLIGVLIGYLYARRDPIWKSFLVRVIIYLVIFYFILPVNNAAHVGGFLAGAPMGYVFYKETRPWRRSRLLGYVAGLMVVACVASIVLSMRSPIWRAVRQQEISRGMQR
jgi:membrane associated rhomboid family serine protease